MPRISTRLVALSCALALAACSGVKVNSDWSSAAGFSGFQTYSWVPAAKSEDSGPADEPVDRRIRAAVDTVLDGKGFRKVDAGGDFVVSYQVTYEDNVTYEAVGQAWEAQGFQVGRLRPSTSRTERAYETVGTVVLGIFDVTSRDLVWNGSASGAVTHDGTSEGRQQRWDEIVPRLLATFPPESQ